MKLTQLRYQLIFWLIFPVLGIVLMTNFLRIEIKKQKGIAHQKIYQVEASNNFNPLK